MKKSDDKKIDHEEKIHEVVNEATVDEGLVWKDKYIRAMADYQNLEKRSGDQIQFARMYAAEKVIARLLPVVDTLSKVQEHIKDMGFDLAYKQLLEVLKEQGVEKMNVLGKIFNPHEMECVEVIDLPAEAKETNDTVIEETLSGYMLKGKVLRVAQVKVGKKISTEPKV